MIHLDDNQGGEDRQSITETAHELLPLSQSKHPALPSALSASKMLVGGREEGGKGPDGLRDHAEHLGLCSQHWEFMEAILSKGVVRSVL